jgi:hypothetical protein
MPNATVRATARTLPEAERPPQPAQTAEELQALASDFEAATARVDEIARKIVAMPTTDIEMMRLANSTTPRINCSKRRRRRS